MRYGFTQGSKFLCAKQNIEFLSHRCSILLIITRLQFFETVTINWSQMSVKMFQAIACSVGFNHGFKKVIMWWHCVTSTSLSSGRLLHSLFTSLLIFAHFLAQYNPIHVTEKSSTDAKSITWILFAFCLQLLRNLQWSQWSLFNLPLKLTAPEMA